MQAFLVMTYRQVKRFFSARSRLIMSIVNPLLWTIFFGLGWSGVFRTPMMRAVFGGLDYMTYLASGIVAMTITMGSFFSGLSVIWDRRFGFLKETLVAPAPRSEVILGRAFGDALTAVIQGLIVLLLMFAIAPGLRPVGILPALGYGLLLATGFSAFGIALAVKLSNVEGFQMIINLITLPLIFTSGAFYPVETMPEMLRYIAYVNPMTYAVDGMRYWLTGVSTFDPTLDVALLAVLSVVMMVAAAKVYEGATIEE